MTRIESKCLLRLIAQPTMAAAHIQIDLLDANLNFEWVHQYIL